MKAKTTKSILAPPRCRHLSPTGRQCCSPAAAPESTLCARHAAAEPQQRADFSAELLDGCGDFQRAQQINHSLIALYKLLAQGRISPRQGAVLAYIGSLVLRSLKAIDLAGSSPGSSSDSTAMQCASHRTSCRQSCRP